MQREYKLEVDVQQYVKLTNRPYLMDVIYHWSKYMGIDDSDFVKLVRVVDKGRWKWRLKLLGHMDKPEDIFKVESVAYCVVIPWYHILHANINLEMIVEQSNAGENARYLQVHEEYVFKHKEEFILAYDDRNTWQK